MGVVHRDLKVSAASTPRHAPPAPAEEGSGAAQRDAAPPALAAGKRLPFFFFIFLLLLLFCFFVFFFISPAHETEWRAFAEEKLLEACPRLAVRIWAARAGAAACWHPVPVLGRTAPACRAFGAFVLLSVSQGFRGGLWGELSVSSA